MSKNYKFSRRRLMQGAGALAGASALGGVIPGLGGVARAQAAATRSAVLVIYRTGSYNGFFSSADSFIGVRYGITAANARNLGNGLMVDNATLGSLPMVGLQNMATLGVRHGSSDHGRAAQLQMNHNNQSAALQLAIAMGGDAAIKCAVVGNQQPQGVRNAIGGVSMQTITDTRTTIAALGGAPDPSVPERDVAALAIGRSSEMSASLMAANTRSLRTVNEGYAASVETLKKPVPVFNFAEMSQAYGVAATTTAVGTMQQKILAAELMIRAGANVVLAVDGFNESHGDASGNNDRNRMNTIMPALRTFVTRTMDPAILPGVNVHVVILGDFARTPANEHGTGTAATVIGPKVLVGTTGKLTNAGQLPGTAPPAAGMWSYLAKVSGVPDANNPFGANPHNLVKP